VASKVNSPSPDQASGRRRVLNGAKSPWACLAIGVVVGACLTRLAGFGGPPTPDGLENALIAENQHLAAKRIQDAYDTLLFAMRIAPTDQRVFATSLEFVRQAARINSDESLALAEDIHERTANLIPFLPLSRLSEARVEHCEAGKSLFPPQRANKPDDPLADPESLLKASLDAHLPSFVRSRLLHDAEAELGGLAVRAVAVQMNSDHRDHFWERWQSVKNRYDEAQAAYLACVYQEECNPKIEAWLKKADDLKAQATRDDVEQTSQFDQRILDLLADGQRLERDVAAYVEGGIEAAIKGNPRDALSKRLTQLSELRDWNYNRWALARVDQIEANSGGALESLKSLTALDETRLSPYVGQRFAEVWKKNFDGCTKDGKVEATKARILRELQQ
jgi:hypothetical protein